MVQLVSRAIWLAKPKWDLNYLEFLGFGKSLVHIKGSKTTENANIRATTIVKNSEGLNWLGITVNERVKNTKNGELTKDVAIHTNIGEIG